MPKPRVAIVLFNLGGPDNQKAVRPFLFNLFNDPAIISLPNPFRYLLAKLISKKRAPIAEEIYQHLGGGSPLLPLTQEQAQALKEELSAEWEVEVFTSMRYWHPFSDDIVLNVRAFAPDHLIALPLYPQYSTTTTASSFKDWKRAAKKNALKVPTSYVCCYPVEEDFIRSHAALIRPVYEAAKQHGNPRILFSAHGLPEKTVAAGDPYQWQVEQTTKAVMEALYAEMNISGEQETRSADRASPEQAERLSSENQEIFREKQIDYLNCYQSRVGPLEWIKPATDDEIKRAGAENIPLVVVPIAFVSEHSETLVELDMEYGKLAEEHGVPHYARVPALGIQKDYISALAKASREAFTREGIAPAGGSSRICPKDFSRCACAV